MIKTYFLGSNSKNGFYSLYDELFNRGYKLHIIKGGPGTGKSSFMRKIGAAAENAGLEVEYILCSGDPASLDAVVIPALSQAWADGTAPHAIEPRIFGVDSDYVNLGKFFKNNFTAMEEEKVRRLSRDYKALYANAYSYLSAASKLRKPCISTDTGELEDRLKRRIDGIIKRNVPKGEVCKAARKVFLSALSCEGRIMLSDDILKLCKLIYRFDDSMGVHHSALDYAAQAATKRGAELILCPSPLEPEKLEALIIPDASLAFVGSEWQLEGARNIRIPTEISDKKELRKARKLSNELMTLAYEKLAEAKSLHDELEKLYIKHMNYPALNRFTEAEIKKLLK